MEIDTGQRNALSEGDVGKITNNNNNENLQVNNQEINNKNKVEALNKRKRLNEKETQITENSDLKKPRFSEVILDENVDSKKYNYKDQGPFPVIVKTTNFSILNDVTLGYKLSICGVKPSQVIKQNKYSAKLIFNDYKNANKLLDQTGKTLLEGHNLKAFLPYNILNKKLVVKGIELEVPISEIAKNIQCEANIVSISRLKRKNRESGAKELVETEAIIVNVRSMVYPNEVIIYGVRKRAEMFRPRVKICGNCLEYGHINKENSCKKQKRCFTCGIIWSDQHHCSKQMSCLICTPDGKSDHPTISAKCPYFKFSEEVLIEANYKNKSYQEVMKERKAEQTGNQFVHPNVYDILSTNHFPELEEPNNTARLNIFRYSGRANHKPNIKPRERERQLSQMLKEKKMEKKTESETKAKEGSLNFVNPHRVSETEKLQSEIEKSQSGVIPKTNLVNQNEIVKSAKTSVENDQDFEMDEKSSDIPEWSDDEDNENNNIYESNSNFLTN